MPRGPKGERRAFAFYRTTKGYCSKGCEKTVPASAIALHDYTARDAARLTY